MEKKSVAFFERGSWYHRTKTLNKDGTVKYGKKGGFESEQDAVKAYKLAAKWQTAWFVINEHRINKIV